MNDLDKKVRDYINSKGTAGMAQEMGKSQQTIKMWLVTGNFPFPVVVHVLDQLEKAQLTAEPPPPLNRPEKLPAPTQLPPRPEEETIVTGELTLEQRVEKLEDFARSLTDPDVPRVSRVLPRPSSYDVKPVAEKTPQTKGAIMGEQEYNEVMSHVGGPEDTDWNKPYTKYANQQPR